jgi:hypothetical protein
MVSVLTAFNEVGIRRLRKRKRKHIPEHSRPAIPG